ncbi:MAG TPA: hypothetical protein VK742_04095 [Candidatus Sulfotelmatobacter sp.]|jgi:hypothetical protein|nr:hypothetical protein [Candidatus Sulfotelmatobacter sp.]
MKTILRIIFYLSRCSSVAAAILVSVAVSAYSQEVNTNGWHPDTRRLDSAADYPGPFGDAASTLTHDVTNFYQLLRDKKWHETYELHAKAFRHDCPKDVYLAHALRGEKNWGLVNYEVLSLGFDNSLGSTNMDQAVLICKFTELPGNTDSYSTVYWHKEDGVWRCLSAGPDKLSIFHGPRTPIVDWR